MDNMEICMLKGLVEGLLKLNYENVVSNYFLWELKSQAASFP